MTSTNSETKYSEPEYARAERKKDEVPYFPSSIDSYLTPAASTPSTMSQLVLLQADPLQTQQMLETYSKIPKAEQSKHVHEIRDQAWAIRTYPCTGMGTWLVPYIAYSPAYAEILQRLKAGERLLDVGCHLGSDMRWLAADGAPTSNMYAVDIVSHWDIGFKLYRDQDKFHAKFIEADILSDDPAILALSGTADIISISAVLHQWSWQDQVTAAKRLVMFSKPNSIVVGHQIGSVEAQAKKLQGAKEANWSHNAQSFEKLWAQVGEETGTTWKTEASLSNFEDVGWDPKGLGFLGPSARVLTWVITRIS